MTAQNHIVVTEAIQYSISVYTIFESLMSHVKFDTRLSQSPSHIRFIRSSTPGAKDFSLLQRAKFTGGFFLLGRDSCVILR